MQGTLTYYFTTQFKETNTSYPEINNVVKPIELCKKKRVQLSEIVSPVFQHVLLFTDKRKLFLVH